MSIVRTNHTNLGQAIARRAGMSKLEPVPHEPRVPCAAMTCAMRARWWVPYRQRAAGLCQSHARTFVEWGERDREHMAEKLWEWPSARALGVVPTDDYPLPARGRDAGVRQATRSPAYGTGAHS